MATVKIGIGAEMAVDVVEGLGGFRKEGVGQNSNIWRRTEAEAKLGLGGRGQASHRACRERVEDDLQ